jgi:hypothetical protein
MLLDHSTAAIFIRTTFGNDDVDHEGNDENYGWALLSTAELRCTGRSNR